MKFHDITTCDMLNGDGLRVVLWLSGCEMNCKNCQNPTTWDPDSGVDFDDKAKEELFSYLEQPYISGITFSGGHPLHYANLNGVLDLIVDIKAKFPDKTIWLYTGYTFEEIVKNSFDGSCVDNLIFGMRRLILSFCDVVVDGRYIEYLRDTKLHWRGSSNQHVINMKATMEKLNNQFIHWQKLMEDEKTIDLEEVEKITKDAIVLHDSTCR